MGRDPPALLFDDRDGAAPRVLQSPYFIPDASIAEALNSAALSGVDVRVMISARPSGDPVPAWAGNTFMLAVARAGVRVFCTRKATCTTRKATCTPRRSASTPRSVRSARPTSTSAASASTTRSMRCSTASGSRGNWRTTSSKTSRTAPSSTRQSIGSATSRSVSGIPPHGCYRRCCESGRLQRQADSCRSRSGWTATLSARWASVGGDAT
jgi:hypothetical protein